VTALIKAGAPAERLAAGESGVVVLNQTPFYAESGGQVGDAGWLVGEGVRARVLDTQKKAGDVFAHMVEVVEGALTVSQPLELMVDRGRRGAIRANHTATHLLHEALRQTLGDHVAQKGSLVSPERLRFDFSHPKAIAAEELEQVERIANQVVLQNEPVVTRLMAVDDAIASGARALFGEKYGDEVRVVSMGTVREGERAGAVFSVELCGGTHAQATGDVGLVTIIDEGAVAAGVRRIEAMTGEAARRHLSAESRQLHALAGLLKTTTADAPDRLAALLEERRKLERDLADARRKLAIGGGESVSAVREVSGVRFFGRAVSGVEMKDLKSLADDAKKQVGSGVVAIVGVGEDGKAGVVVGVTEDLTGRFDAVALVRAACEALGGKGGGGRRDMAQAGGPDGGKAEEALAAIESRLAA
jgi:alanyl-tRNA synthetase